jgi:hypothetical protein
MHGGRSDPLIVWPSGLLQEQSQEEQEKGPTGNSDDCSPTDARDVHGTWTLAADRLAAKLSKARHSLPRVVAPPPRLMVPQAAAVLASHLTLAPVQPITCQMCLGSRAWAREVAGVVAVAQKLANHWVSALTWVAARALLQCHQKTKTLMVQVPTPVTLRQMMWLSLALAPPPLVVLVAQRQPTYLTQHQLDSWTLMMQLPALVLPASGSSKNANATATVTATASATAAMATGAVGFEALTARRRWRATKSAGGAEATVAPATMARATIARHHCHTSTSVVADRMVAAPASERLLPSAVATQAAATQETPTW